MRPLVLPAPGNDTLAAALADALDAEPGRLDMRCFPDGETYVRIESEPEGRRVVLCCTLDRPDERTLPLLLLAATARDLGARRVGLVAPYLGYMRQDGRFRPGEGITSTYFARLVSSAFDWLVTVDPHLHRHASLGELYAIPAASLRAAPLLAEWVGRHVDRPLLVGPDSESAQWVAAVAAHAGAPWLALEKVRRGDREVEVSLPGIERWRGRTAVVLDDIISTARTMVATIAALRRLELAAPVCLAVHAVFASGAREELDTAGAARVVTTNTIPHPTNAIDVGTLLAEGVRDMLGADG